MDDGAAADVLVVFGITGDLARKMTFRALYRLVRQGRMDCPVLGVASDTLTTEQLVARARAAIAEGGETVDEAAFDRFARRLDYLAGDVTDAALYRRLAEQIEKVTAPGRRVLYYLEVPPSLFTPIVEHLGGAGLLRNARVAVEKPFGHDLASARKLNARLHAVLDEGQILRVDHFLGKEPVISLQYLRFANLPLAELRDHKSVSRVQITMAEDFGVSARGRFYDKVGALRDVVQNHLLQVLALVAMDPPVGSGADDLRNRKVEVFRAMPPAEPRWYVRGQYEGYRDVPGVAVDSTTETYAALRVEIDNWRWMGVPFFIRTGKCLPERVTEVRLILRRTPRLAFLPAPAPVEPNQIVLRIDPDPGMRLRLSSRDDHGAWRAVHLDTLFARELGEPLDPYERLLDAALRGDPQLFAREDGVEQTWRIVQPLLADRPPVHSYPRGSWGPEQAEALVQGHPGWHRPWLPEDR